MFYNNAEDFSGFFDIAGQEYIRNKKQSIRTFTEALCALQTEHDAVVKYKNEVRITLTVLEGWLAYKKSAMNCVYGLFKSSTLDSEQDDQDYLTANLGLWYLQKYSRITEEHVINYAPPAEQWDALDELEASIHTYAAHQMLSEEVTPEELVDRVLRYKKTHMTPQQQALVPNAAVVLSERFAPPVITTAHYLALYSINSPEPVLGHLGAEIPSAIGYPVDPALPSNAPDL